MHIFYVNDTYASSPTYECLIDKAKYICLLFLCMFILMILYHLIDEAQYLDGEKLITFLMDKIQQIRRIYMNLKTEVASIDRRRKRAKRKERESKYK